MGSLKGKHAALVAAAVLGCTSASEPPSGFDWRYDDFDGVDPEPWDVLHPGLADASIAGGELRLRPAAMTAWQDRAEAYHHYLTVAGDFAITSHVRVGDLQGGPVLPDWRLGGLLIRDPGAGAVDAYHAAFGTVSAQMHAGLVVEYRSTVAGASDLGFVPRSASQGELRICRVGSVVRSAYRTTGEDAQWILLDERERPELGITLAVGPIAHANSPVGAFEAAFDYVDVTPIDALADCAAERAESPATPDDEPATTGDTDDGGDDPADDGNAKLPEHEPIEILVISDSVNPSGLSDSELIQAGDLGAALTDPSSPLATSFVHEIGSACVDEALGVLDAGAPDVIVYFAHEPAKLCDGRDVQAELTAAMELHLELGGGVVVFHHGIYEVPGKEAILQLLGGRADRLQWSPVPGQTVVNVAPDHFVTTHALVYPAAVELGDADLGISPGLYESFTNEPDERYPGLQLSTVAGEERELLFASDYDGTQVLGYDLRRPGWTGHVVLYQPGEHAPTILDPAGPNFQILVNAIYYAATTRTTGS